MNHAFKLYPDGTLKIVVSKECNISKVVVRKMGEKDCKVYLSNDDGKDHYD